MKQLQAILPKNKPKNDLPKKLKLMLKLTGHYHNNTHKNKHSFHCPLEGLEGESYKTNVQNLSFKTVSRIQ